MFMILVVGRAYMFIAAIVAVDVATDGHAVMTSNDIDVVDDSDELRMIDIAVYRLSRIDNGLFRAIWTIRMTGHACNSFPGWILV
ncbi:hypothetical protein VE23_02235 [Paenibacillus sp. D9]|nr:hypothetical protein VE23_02235 [Paenibacillus sp. D9]